MKGKKYISLEEIEKKVPFSVPENYFENFATKMDEQLGLKKEKARYAIRSWMYIAAIFVGIVVFGQVYFNIFNLNSTSTTENYSQYVLSQLDETSMMDYYLEENGK